MIRKLGKSFFLLSLSLLTSLTFAQETSLQPSTPPDTTQNVDGTKVKTISLSIPNGGEVWQIGKNKTITWTSTEIVNIKIEYTTTGGTSWVTANPSVTASLGKYTWFLDPATVNASQEAKIRISDVDNAAIFDTSTAVFTISSLDFNTPNDSSNIQVNRVTPINWDASADINFINLEFSSNGGTSWNSITANYDVNNTPFNWTYTGSSSSILLRIKDSANPTLVSDQITLFPRKLEVTSPNGGENWFAGSTHSIQWNSSNVTNIDIKYSVDAGPYQDIVTNYSAGSVNYIWTVPDVVSNEVRIRIFNSADASIFDETDSTFTISNLDLTFPIGGEGIESESNQTITWNSNIAGNVKIELSTNGGLTFPNELATGIPATQGFANVTFPDAATNQARVKITSLLDPTISVTSTSNFTIGSISIISPSGGESWLSGTTHAINWTASSGISIVKIDYSTDGVTWFNITSTANASAGTYNWSIPPALSASTAYIRIYDSATELNKTNISNVFSIALLNLTNPNGNQAVHAGEIENIAWNASANITNLTIEYSTNSGTDWSTIATGIDASLGLFAWNVPSGLSTKNGRVRITAENDGSFTRTSVNDFKIGDLDVLTPNGGESIGSGSVYTVTWTRTASIDSLQIQYSLDGGGSYINIPGAEAVNAASGSYNWVVPNFGTTTARIRIRDAEYNTLLDESDNNFTIARLQVTTPNGGEGYSPGAAQTITWISSSVNQISVEYSSDGGSTWSTIASPVNAADGSVPWTVPASPTSQGRIRIVSLDDPLINDMSNSNFKIGSVEITTPNGGEIYQSGDTETVTYDFDPSITSIDIELSTNNGVSWNPVQSGVTATGTYSWTISNVATSNALLRIKDSDSPNLSDVSDGTFSIKRLSLTTPNGNEFYMVDSTYNIIWQSGNITNVKLEYSIDGGSNWNIITASTNAAAGLYAWTVPDNASRNAIVRISDADNPDKNISDVSNAVFTINKVDVKTPIGGENFVVNDIRAITWDAHTSVANIKIEYSTNNGTSWNTVAASVAAANKTYNWTIPNTPTSQGRIRISDAADNTVYDINDAAFAIGSVLLTAPNGGERWQVNSIHQITWTTITTIANVDLEYSPDNGTTWISIVNNINANLESYDWTIPNNITPNARVRVSSSSDPLINDVSNGAFDIANLQITTPNGGEVVQIGEPLSITWNAENIDSVNIDFSSNNGSTWQSIAANYPAPTEAFNWTVIDAPTQNALIRIYDSEFNAVADVSDAVFRVLRLRLTSPNGGEGWRLGENYNITWNSSGITNLNIDVSTNAGTSWIDLQDNVNAATGSYNWTVPDSIIGNQVKLRLVDAANPNVKDESDNNFTAGRITITKPVLNEVWQAGSIEVINWTSTSGLGTVRIEYSIDGGTTFTVIDSLNADVGTYSWDVPAGLSTSNAVIRIVHLQAATDIYDNSDLFTINSLQLTSPTGEELWSAGSTQNITWNSANITNMKIEYSPDDGATWSTVIASTPAAAGSYAWNIPAGFSSDQALIKISDAANATIVDSSSANFKIGSVVITSPTSADIWQSSTTKKITWTASSSISSVKIEFSTNNGSSWVTPPITEAIDASLGEINWSIGSNYSTSNARIRISDVDSDLNTVDNNIFDNSDPFKLVYLNLSSPNGSENWQTGSIRNITWTSSNLLNNLNLFYSIDGGNNWINIANNVAANSSPYSWTIPDGITTTSARIKLVSAEYASIIDSSTNNFTLNSLELTYPAGGEELQAGKQYNLTWNSTNISNVQLQYTTDNGSNWADITPSTSASGGSYSWNIPGNISSNQAAVRILRAGDANTQDQSATFTIKRLEVISPDGTEEWQGGSTQAITWISSQINFIDIFYTTNNGTDWISIASNVQASLGTYNWNIPDTIFSEEARVKLVDSGNNLIDDESDANFTIGTLSLTSPAGGEKWQAGSSHQITWNSANIDNVKLEYSVDNGANWITIISSVDADAKNYNWTIDNAVNTNQALVRISSATDANVSDQSGLFTIPLLAVTSPNGGEVWKAEATKAITWNSGNISTVELFYTTNNGTSWESISQNINASLGTYNWSIPAGLSTSQARIRIVDESDNTILDRSDATFSIGTLELTSPAGGEKWQAGSTHNITWSSTNIDSVKLEYSLDNGTSWTLIKSSIGTSLGVYAWTLPNNSSSQALVRVSASTDPSFNDINSVFTIALLEVTSPNGSEVWQAGSTHPITWNSGSVSNINISYSSDNGVTWNSIASNVAAAAGTRNWIIPSSLTTTEALVKIEDASDASIVDQSDNIFTVNNLELTSPAASTIWQAGTIRTIKWSSSNVGNVKLEYSVDGGGTWNEITSSISSLLGSHDWNIPSALSTTQARVRITSVDNPSVSDVSPDFTINQLQLTSPGGGEQYQAGSTQAITWTSSNVNQVNLSYSTDNGVNWTTIANNVQASLGTKNWNIPGTISTNQARVRIVDATTSTTRDSSSTFTIGTLTLTSPLGGEQWQSGKTHQILWTGNETFENISIEYSIDGGTSWNFISASYPADSGSYSWSIPTAVFSNQARIRIKDTSGGFVQQTSADFTISRLIVTSPNGGQYWQSGTTKQITWTADHINNLKIEFSSDGGTSWSELANSEDASSGTFDWTITPTTTSTNNGIIRLSDASNSTVSDRSDAVFTVGNITVTTPNGGEVIQAGLPYTITWSNTASVSDVKIEYSIDSGTSWQTVINSTEADGSYKWNVPGTLSSSTSLIRITDIASSGGILDVSDNAFTFGALLLTSPDGGEALKVGSTHAITWTAGTNIANVKLEYFSPTAGWQNIVGSTPAAAGTYNWTVPNSPTDLAKVRVSSVANPTIINESDSTFRIANLAVTSPNTAVKWQVGTTKAITWSRSSNVANIDIYYKVGAGNWENIILNTAASTGTYNWLVPDETSTSAKIRIVDSQAPAEIIDSSDVSFTITKLNLTSPDTSVNWLSGSTQSITWEASSDLAQLEIKYSTNNGSTWNVVTNSVAAAAGEYSWTIPSSINSSNSLIKINDKNVTTITSTSGLFTISEASLTLTSPLGGEYWQAGKQYQITWNATSNVDNISIEYSLDGGGSWNNIESPVSAVSGTYNWTIPISLQSTQAQIKITDAVNSFLADSSDFDFTIGNVTLTYPNGGEHLQAARVENITWTNSASVANVKIELSTNGGTNWITLVPSTPAAAGSYAWTVNNLPTSNARVRVNDAASSNGITDQSESDFSISLLELTSPNGGEVYQAGDSKTILWTASADIATVQLEYSTDGVNWNAINTTPIVASLGEYTWSIPQTLCSTNLQIRVKNFAFPQVLDISDAVFTVKQLDIVNPTGGENWQVGTTQNLDWDVCGILNIKIEYSSNNGTTWNTIINSHDATQVYNWTVPSVISSQMLVRVTDVVDGNIRDTSGLFSTFNPALSLTSPDGGEHYQAGETYNITWSSSLISNIKIEFSDDDGISWTSLANSFDAALGSYPWSINQSVETTSGLIKISDVDNPHIQDSSANSFTVSKLQITSPTGGEYWQSGTTKAITWTASASIPNVKIQYSTDDGSTWNNIAGATSIASGAGSYSWNIPSSVSSVNARIRIQHSTNANIKSISPEAFTIGNVAVVQPNGGELLQAGKTALVKWTRSTSVAEVLVELFDLNDNTIITSKTSSAASGQTNLLIPSDALTDSAIVRISDNASSYNILDSSDASFAIVTLDLTKPNASTNWPSGSTQEVTWTNSTGISLVSLEYSLNNGLTWDTIGTNINSSLGKYNWPIPNDISSNEAKVRVYSPANPSIADTSDKFNIYVRSLTVTSPDGGEHLPAGDVYSIRWTSNFVITIQIEFSSNNGTDWDTLTTSAIASDSAWAWNIPSDLDTKQGLIRIRDITNPSLVDVSDANFSIGSIDVTNPTSGEKWLAGSDQNISWNTTSSVELVNIYYSLDPTANDSDWVLIKNNVDASLGNYYWAEVPSVESSRARIIITDAESSKLIKSYSDEFTIARLEIASPNGGEFWQSGTSNLIEWYASSSIGVVNIDLSTDNGVTWSTSIASNVNAGLGSINWNIPEGLISDSAKIRIADITDAALADTSDAIFHIGTLSLTSLNDGGKVLVGQTRQITWTTSPNVTNVDIHYQIGDGIWRQVVLGHSAASLNYDWLIPDTPTDTAYVRIRDSANPDLVDSSNSFTIAKLDIDSPNGGEVWQSGTTHQIQWESQFLNNLRIEFSSNNGSNWTTIFTNVDASSGSHDWLISASLFTDSAKIRISDMIDPTLVDSSQNVFQIGSVQLTVFNSAQKVLGTSEQQIRWDFSSSIQNIDLHYKTSDGVWTPITLSYPADSMKYTWTVPDIPSQNVYLRIRDALNTSIQDTNDAPITIARLNLATPNGGEVWQAGNTNQIQWESEFIDAVKIEFSSNNGSNWTTLYPSVIASEGTVDWSIPTTLFTDSAKIRISDAASPTLIDVSESVFQIGSLQLTVFNSTQKILEGSSQVLRWDFASSIENIDLHYRTSDGVWRPIVLSYPADSMAYSWIVPEDPSDSVYVRVRDALNHSLHDTSNAPVTISRLKLTTPNGGEVWKTGTTQSIAWESEFVDQIRIEYTTDTDDSPTWRSLTSSALNAEDGSFNWVIDDDVNLANPNYKIRLRDVASSNIIDTSESTFTISYINLISPNGGEGQQLGTAFDIEWGVSTNTISKVNLYVQTTDGSLVWSPIELGLDADDLTYHWLIDITPSSTSKIKVEDADNPEIYDESDDVFTISEIELLFPNGSAVQKVQVGKTYSVTWKSTYINDVLVEYSVNNGVSWNRIGTASADTEEISWTVDNVPSRNARIRVSDLTYPTIYDESDTTFAISSMRLLNPNELLAFKVGSEEDITWETTNVDTVRIQLSTDSGLTWPVEVATVPAADGTFTWLVPNLKTVNAKIRITDQYDINVSDISDTTFVIGDYPQVSSVAEFQSGTVKLLYDFGTPGETISLTELSFQKGTSSPINSTAYLLGDYSAIVGPDVDTIKWNSKGNLDEYEGTVDVIVKFQSNYNVTYEIKIQNVGVDNKAPRFDSEKLSITQNPFTQGWDESLVQWDAASDTSAPIKYSVYVSDSSSFSSTPRISTTGKQGVFRDILTSTKYNIRVDVEDNLGNLKSYNYTFRSLAAGDFNNDKILNAVDLASYVKSWTREDSLSGADLYPYTKEIPFISINGDNILEIEDLLTFVDMWNYYQEERTLPKISPEAFTASNESDRKTLKFSKGDSKFTFPLELESEKELIAFSAEIHYGTEAFSFDSLEIKNTIKNTNALSLVYVDSVNGIININYADLSGKLIGEFSLSSNMEFFFDRLSHRDSLLISVKAYDNSLKQAVTKNTVYTMLEVPSEYKLYQNYPNPFNPSTKIEYDLPVKTRVNLTVFDILGRVVTTLVDREQNEGTHQIILDAYRVRKGLASGVYFYRLSAGDYVVTKKMLLLK
ncbi:MAG: T9SS type A sorting domain-containing protein [Melioribacteraceae bacterium]|nr:T9SS type A sorting domain-containing protein [Melioribacteraceae bacterium]MCF8352798.1 T9SS type A sorting domain-containing protein [Melioribacteraceae bacterium]MCF8417315.1 T9SS type A sorting domain-containing protein [Melioribacteraceae bacterium]